MNWIEARKKYFNYYCYCNIILQKLNNAVKIFEWLIWSIWKFSKPISNPKTKLFNSKQEGSIQRNKKM